MIEIRYGENYEMADLAGKSVAQAREQYKQEFGIPDKAQASLNGKGIRQKHEPVTALGDNDSLTFARKSRKGLFFIGTILLALAITGGVFAYGATTITVGLDLTAQGDFAAVTAAPSPPVWDVWGSYKGSVDTGDLFTVTPDVPGGWTGDMSVVLTLTNAHELVAAYRILVFEIEIWDSAVQWEVTTAPSGAGDDATITITYTNQDGVTGQTATATIPQVASLGDTGPVILQSPDTGIREITAIGLTGWSGASAGVIAILGGEATLGTIDYINAFTTGATITPVQVGTTEYLTMANGEISIQFIQTANPPYAVKLTNGFYITHRGGWTTNAEDPSIFAQVLQRSAP